MDVSGPVVHFWATSGYCGRSVKGKARADGAQSRQLRLAQLPRTDLRAEVLVARRTISTARSQVRLKHVAFGLDRIALTRVPRKPCGIAQRRALHQASSKPRWAQLDRRDTRQHPTAACLLARRWPGFGRTQPLMSTSLGSEGTVVAGPRCGTSVG
jgi:hypothetical protein